MAFVATDVDEEDCVVVLGDESVDEAVVDGVEAFVCPAGSAVVVGEHEGAELGGGVGVAWVVSLEVFEEVAVCLKAYVEGGVCTFYWAAVVVLFEPGGDGEDCR